LKIVLKKERGEKIRDYRDIILMLFMYTKYTVVLAKKLRQEMDEKGILE